jgi:biopolymer transport protein ExbD
MFKKMHRSIPELNTTSTADISFMLLIFFLVTSSMDTDKGLRRLLPKPTDEQEQRDVQVQRRNVLEIGIDADSHITMGGEPIEPAQICERVARFVANEQLSADLPQLTRRNVPLLGTCLVSDRHIIVIKAHRDARYDTYFQVQNAIVDGYLQLRNQLARQHFGHPYRACTAEQREAVATVYPQRVSEQIPLTASMANYGQAKKGGRP